MIVVAIIAFERGDPKRLASPFDPDGNQNYKSDIFY